MKPIIFVILFFISTLPAVALPTGLECPGVKVIIRPPLKEHWNSPHFDKGENSIVLITDYMNKLSDVAQKFIFYHECGHAQGIRNETLADKFAYQRTKDELTETIKQEICKDHGEADRCYALLRNYRK